MKLIVPSMVITNLYFVSILSSCVYILIKNFCMLSLTKKLLKTHFIKKTFMYIPFFDFAPIFNFEGHVI